MKRNLLMLLSAAALASAVPAYAHHSFAATYFEDKTQTIEGIWSSSCSATRTRSSTWKRRTKKAICSAGRSSGAPASSSTVRA